MVGKYANTDLYKGDYILESKLSDTPMLKNAYLGKLNGENRAISVSIKSLAAGLSGKLEAGDIVTLIASDVGEKRKTLVLPELQYVEIIATTASSGTDNDVQADVEDGEEQELASTITVLATPEQARLLADLEQTGKLHAALVFRGDSTQVSSGVRFGQRAQIISGSVTSMSGSSGSAFSSRTFCVILSQKVPLYPSPR